jgi:3D (Asp-Asp-Asp) domain-containing protein
MSNHPSYRLSRFLLIAGILVLPQMASTSVLSGAAGGQKPKIVPVKATAYSSGAKCNGAWSGRNAVGGRLKSGVVNSAAADWSRFPVGTKFRVKETGKVYQVDDYGSAMVGKDKVDLFMPDYGQVYRWGVRHVTLEIVEWGSAEKSLKILKPRSKSGHVRKMVEKLEANLKDRDTKEPSAG